MKIRLKSRHLKRALATSGRSQNAWALVLGVSPGHLSNLLSGRRAYPSAALRRRLLEKLGLEFQELFEIETEEVDEGPEPHAQPLTLLQLRWRHLSLRLESLRPSTVEAAAPRLSRPEAQTTSQRIISAQTTHLDRGEKMARMAQDLQFSLRIFRRNPGFALIIFLILALGVGANTAIFSVVNGVLLRPLPFPSPQELVMVWLDNRVQGWHEDITSYPNFVDWKDRNQVFEEMAGFTPRRLTLTGEGAPERIAGAAVMASFFKVFSVPPLLGTFFGAQEEFAGADQSVLLSHDLWQTRYGSNRDILGRTLELEGRRFQVIGVMPEGFDFPPRAQMWVPLAMAENIRQSRGSLWLRVVGRLRDGVAVREAQLEMNSLAAQLETENPQFNEGYGVNLEPLHEELVGGIQPTLLALMAAVILVLVIACANIANLLLARASTRRREMAVRSALGARRGQLVSQLLLESVSLAMAGGIAGILLAYLLLRVLIVSIPGDLPRIGEIQIDLAALLFGLGISLLTGILFGLAPAFQSARAALNRSLIEGTRGSTADRGSKRLRNILVVAEIALSLILLVTAGLLTRSLLRMNSVDPGFDSARMLAFDISLPATKYPEATDRLQFLESTLNGLRALPGVEAAGATTAFFIPALANSGTFTIEGRAPFERAEQLEVPIDAASAEFFEAAGVPLIEGRTFSSQDSTTGEPVVMINQTMAARFWPGQSPVGSRLKYGPQDSTAPWLRIIGVVGDAKRSGLDQPVRPSTFVAASQRTARSWTFVVRAAQRPTGLTGLIRDVVLAIDRDLPVLNLQTGPELLAEAKAGRRFVMAVIGMFAAFSLVLAALGIYGVISYSVNQTSREISVRMALGAERKDVLGLVLKQGVMMTAAGIAVGIFGSWLATRFLDSLLFDTSATDPLTYLIISLVVGVAALFATGIPALRATRVNPVTALSSQ